MTFKEIYTNPIVLTVLAIIVIVGLIMWFNRDTNDSNGDAAERVNARCLSACLNSGRSRTFCIEFCSSASRMENAPSNVVTQGFTNPTGTVGGLGGVIGTGTPVGGIGGGGPRPGAIG